MPKDRRVNSSSFDRAMVSPYSCSLKITDGSNGSSPLVGDEREWEEARCPICMEHPHNAVLLVCSSREKGCLPFICDTSYRHSNCFDQLRKSADVLFLQTPFDQQKCELVCPLCRGLVTGWDVIHPAREFMNSKTRSCSLETCSFDGNYSELRKHARLAHPSGRPSETSPNRQSNWEALERRTEIEDVFALQSDIEYDLDNWFNLDPWGDDILSDEDFFDFSSGMSDTENDPIGEMFSVALSLFGLCPSSPDEMMETGSSRGSERPPRSVLPTNSNLRSDNHAGYISHSSRSVSRNHSEEGGVLRSRSSYYPRGTDLNLNLDYDSEYVPISSRTRSSYPMGNASTNLRSISSSRQENASNNIRSRSGYHRVNAPTSSSARLSYPRQNGQTGSGLRSSYFRENGPSSSRARSSYFRENAPSRSRARSRNFRQDMWSSSSSRARTTFHPSSSSRARTTVHPSSSSRARTTFHPSSSSRARTTSPREEAYSPVSGIHLRGSPRRPHSSHGRHQV
ncbi:hypothetical protein ACS0TY_012462 [Phlomoides rotata]